MSFEEFENQARLYVVGALDTEETELFRAARGKFGQQAEAFINECRKLNSVFALSLRPKPPEPSTREKLLAQIRRLSENGEKSDSSFENGRAGGI
jgi:hypothetical protein